jgi:hypothetical protein
LRRWTFFSALSANNGQRHHLWPGARFHYWITSFHLFVAVFNGCPFGAGICGELAQQLLHRFLPLLGRSREIDFRPPTHVLA